jgi:hypothetical protein
MVAPEPYFSACMAVVYSAVISARSMSWSGNVDSEQLGDLMDAIHNIPEMVKHWETCDVEFMRNAFLKVYDEKWSSRSGLSLCKAFEQALLAAKAWNGSNLKLTHAYFPALMSCCSTLEYLAGLFVGRADTSISRRDIAGYAERYMPQPDYDGETIRILIDAFRNAVAHRGISTGIWRDEHAAHVGRRITWKIFEDDSKPSLALRAESGFIRRDSPWPCAYTHRMYIHLSRLGEDIRDSSQAYLQELKTSKPLLSNFERCMKQLYPWSQSGCTPRISETKLAVWFVTLCVRSWAEVGHLIADGGRSGLKMSAKGIATRYHPAHPAALW